MGIRRAHTNRLVLYTFLCFLCISSSLALAQPVGVITSIEGKVYIQKTDEPLPQNIDAGDSVALGDVLITRSDGRAEITFIDTTRMTLSPRSRLKIAEYLFTREKGQRSARVKLYNGKNEFIIPKIADPQEGNSFTLQTPTAVTGVRGTEGILTADTTDRVYIKEGVVDFSNRFGKVAVTPGRVGESMHNKAPEHRAYKEAEYNLHKKEMHFVAPRKAEFRDIHKEIMQRREKAQREKGEGKEEIAHEGDRQRTKIQQKQSDRSDKEEHPDEHTEQKRTKRQQGKQPRKR